MNQNSHLGLIVTLLKQGKTTSEIKKIVKCNGHDLRTAYAIVGRHKKEEAKRLQKLVNPWQNYSGFIMALMLL
tara:strand:- start:761 stop:979 length:219 start_codon:yes stop_codon:yes gene_type:complete